VFIFDTKNHHAAGAEGAGEEHSGEQECKPDLRLAGEDRARPCTDRQI
jgi:hypothetical protein